MRALVLIGLVFHLTLPCLAVDLNYRFQNGFCQKQGRPGYNPKHWGQCGNLVSAKLVNEQHSDSQIIGSHMDSSYIYTSRYQGGDWSFVLLRRAILFQSSWQNTKADNVDLRGSHIKGSQFQDVSLKNLWASGSRFTQTQFLNCDLQGANFWGANLQEVNFTGSDLRGADLRNTFRLFTEFKGAKINSQTRLPFSREEAHEKGMISVE